MYPPSKEIGGNFMIESDRIHYCNFLARDTFDEIIFDQI